MYDWEFDADDIPIRESGTARTKLVVGTCSEIDFFSVVVAVNFDKEHQRHRH